MWRPAITLVWLAGIAESSLLVPRFTNDSCVAQCTAFDVIERWYWQKQEVTATITAATVILIIDDRTNQTRTSTKTNELPAGVTPPPTNAQGTHVTTFPVETAKGQSSDVVLAYPNEFVHYPLSYGWYGTLSTTDAKGQGICSTVNSDLTTQFVDYTPYSTPAQATGAASVDTADPKGFIYSLIGYGCYEPPDKTLNPGDAAPLSCSVQGACGVSALSTVQFLTDTSVSHESSSPETTPAAAPAASTTPAPKQAQTSPTTPAPAATGAGGGQQQQQTTTPAAAAAPAPAQTQPAVIVVGASTATANTQSGFVIAGQTLTQGGQIVAGGTTVSLASGGSIAVVNGITQSVVTPGSGSASQAAVLTLAGQTITANAAGQFIVGSSTTLTVGGAAVTLSGGTVVSLATNAAGQTVEVVNGHSSTLTQGTTGGIGGAIASGLGSTTAPAQFVGAGVRARPRDIWWAVACPVLFTFIFAVS